MTNSLKLALLTVALGTAFSAQSSSYQQDSASPVFDMGIPFSGVEFLTMTTSFSGDGFSGSLRSGFANGTVFYQILNDSSSSVALGDIEYVGYEPRRGGDINYGYAPVVSQTGQAFEIFTVGQNMASLTRTREGISGGEQAPTFYTQTIDFMGGPAWTGGFGVEEIVYGEVLPGVLPGMASYTQMVSALESYSGWYTRGKVDINGVSVNAFVSVVPEPETYAMLLAGLGMIGAVVRRKNAQV